MVSVGILLTNAPIVLTIIRSKEPNMPKEGFQSLTIPQDVYNRLVTHYKTHRIDLGCRGISSVSGLAVSFISQSLPKQERE